MDSPLKPRDLCNIIKACKDSGVAKLSYKGVTLEFFDKPDSQSNVELNTQNLLASQPNIQDTKDSVLPVTVPQSQILERDEERALLLIDHPEHFENLMIDEDLERTRKTTIEVNDYDEEDDSGARANLQ